VKTRLLIAWLLLLIPTLILGVGALRLLENEESRLIGQAKETARSRVLAIADSIDVSVTEVKNGLLDTLRSLPQRSLIEQLDDWKRTNPLVRNVFVWQQGRGLLHPDPEQPASDEEAIFIRRYLMLFANQAAWQPPAPDLPTTQKNAPAKTLLAERKKLRSLAQQAPMPASITAASDSYARPADGADGWIPWFADNRLHMLGWYAPDGSTQRSGVELEMMALLSRLLGTLPTTPADGETYGLIDGNGQLFHQVGPLEISDDDRPLASVDIRALPHWRVVAYAPQKQSIVGGSFMLISTLLVGTFVIAILLGGSLLLWQAYRNQRDARQKTSFVSNVSHELKTPLTTIRMYAELLGEGKITEPIKRQRYLQTIIRESQRLTRLVNNVLDFSRLEQGHKEYALVPIDFSTLLNDLLDSQSMRIDETGLNLLRQIRPEQHVVSDRDALEQIVLNLLDNGLKYAASGGELCVDLEPDRASVILRIRDRGPGIPADQQKKIFDKFHRIDASVTARKQGTGLGLSIARQLAEGIGGHLTYCPHQGGGACFELTLPKTERA
jgi:signal transduction histidine kinase